jgi:hypothetical protein
MFLSRRRLGLYNNIRAARVSGGNGVVHGSVLFWMCSMIHDGVVLLYFFLYTHWLHLWSDPVSGGVAYWEIPIWQLLQTR